MLLAAVLGLSAGTRAQTGDPLPLVVHKLADKEHSSLYGLYCYLHEHPELPGAEKKTAERIARELTDAGWVVTKNVGGHGVVAVLKNGDGPVSLVRFELDGQGVTERTGLPYASKVRARRGAGHEGGIMHASGHDMHMAVGVGAARILSQLKAFWKGTLVFVAQGASATGKGALAMLDDGLLEKWPRPAAVLAFQVDAHMPAGRVGCPAG